MLMDVRKLENVRDCNCEKDYERLLKIMDHSIPMKDKSSDLKMFFGNKLAGIKRNLRTSLIESENIKASLRSVRRRLKLEEQKTFQNNILIDDLQELEQGFREQIDAYKDYVASCADIVASCIQVYETVATDHDMAQILNANYKDVMGYRKDFQEEKERDGSFFDALIFSYKAEARSDDRENREFICNHVAVPFFAAFYEAFSKKLREDREFKKKTDEVFEDMFPEVRGMKYVATTDESGEVVMEKYYPPLKVIEETKETH